MASELETAQGIVRVPTGTWTVDAVHSSVEFRVKHMMIATVRGHFREFEGTIEAAPDYHASSVRGTVSSLSFSPTASQVGKPLKVSSYSLLSTITYALVVRNPRSGDLQPPGGQRLVLSGESIGVRDALLQFRAHLMVEPDLERPAADAPVVIQALSASAATATDMFSGARAITMVLSGVGTRTAVLADRLLRATAARTLRLPFAAIDPVDERGLGKRPSVRACVRLRLRSKPTQWRRRVGSGMRRAFGVGLIGAFVLALMAGVGAC